MAFWDWLFGRSYVIPPSGSLVTPISKSQYDANMAAMQKAVDSNPKGPVATLPSTSAVTQSGTSSYTPQYSTIQMGSGSDGGSYQPAQSGTIVLPQVTNIFTKPNVPSVPASTQVQLPKTSRTVVLESGVGRITFDGMSYFLEWVDGSGLSFETKMVSRVAAEEALAKLNIGKSSTTPTSNTNNFTNEIPTPQTANKITNPPPATSPDNTMLYLVIGMAILVFVYYVFVYDDEGGE